MFTVASASALCFTSPTAHVSWKRGTSHTVSWQMSEPSAVGGEYAVWIVAPSGRTWQLDSAIAGTTTTVRVNQPAGGGYRLIVRWRGSSSGPWVLSGRSALVTIVK